MLDFAKSDNEKLQSAAIAALANYHSDTLRRLALELIREQPESVQNGVIKLLINNYKSGDFWVLESVLSISQDSDLQHSIGMDLIELINAQKTTELKECSLWVYENTPCSYCRQQIVEILIALRQTPQSMLQECLHDCSSKIRSLVQKEVTKH